MTNVGTAAASATLAWQTRLAVLWLIQIANYVSYIFISTQESLVAMEVGSDAAAALVLAVFFFVPCLVAWLTFAGSESVARWLNIVFGALFALLKLVATFGAAVGQIARPDGTVSPALIFNELWAIPVAALIVWIAWRGAARASTA